MAAVRQLELDPCRIAFCLLPQQSGNKDTAASHIQKVLLQAFCYEQNIAIIQVIIILLITFIINKLLLENFNFS